MKPYISKNDGYHDLESTALYCENMKVGETVLKY